MGRYGQAILTIVGTVVGAYFGYPGLGTILGSLAGQLIFPTKLPTIAGPRLADISQTQSMVGAPVPRCWGTIAVAGTIIHQTNIREVIETDDVGGGSGGPSQKVETATYYSDFAIGLSDCPTDPIAGIRRIWANGKILYDRTPQRDDETTAEFSSRMAANATLDNTMTIYLGTDTQLPDPTLEAFYGVGNVSAHLNLAYVVFANWLNKIEDGQRMPAQWKFEIFNSASIQNNELTEYSGKVLFPWKRGGAQTEPLNDLNAHDVTCNANGLYDCPMGTFDTLAEVKQIMAANRTVGPSPSKGTPSNFVGYRFQSQFLSTMEGALTLAGHDAVTVILHYNHFPPTRFGYDSDPGGGTTCGFAQEWFIDDNNQSPLETNLFQYFLSNSTFRVIGISPFAPGVIEPGTGWDIPISGCPLFDYATSEDFEIQVSREVRAPDDPCHQRGVTTEFLPGSDDFCIVGGQVVAAGPWTHVTGGAFHMLAIYAEETIDGVLCVKQYPLNPTRPNTHPQYNDQPFWEAAYANAVSLGLMPAGEVYGVDYPVFMSEGWYRTVSGETAETNSVSVDDIVRDLCVESGFDPADVNVTDLAGLEVIGYCRTRVMAARAALDPLRQAKFFDGYESGRTIRFTRRGGAIARTFENDELGIVTDDNEQTTRVSSKDMQERELPRQVRVHYMSVSRDYEPGEQPSPARVDTDSVNDVDLELPIPMTDSEAKQIAQVLWADAWASRTSHEIVVDVECQELEPTDVIEVPVDGVMQRCRIVDVTDTLPVSRRFALVRDDDGAYESFAVADEPPVIPNPPKVYSPSEMIALDIPLLRDEDDGPGFYVAARPFITGGFQGASIYRSTDGGGNFTKVISIGNPAVTGRLLENLPPGGYSTPDLGNHIQVRLDDFDLSSITREAMLIGLAGSNAAAIGEDGRWEIVQFQDVEDLGGGIFRLTTLLRGRRGTEHLIGTSETGDRFVLLSGPGIYWVPLQLQELGREYLYRAVGTGSTIDGATDVLFTAQGVPLEPFSPVDITGSRDPDTAAWTINWIRRGRIGQTLPGGTDIPLSEEVEDYEVGILRNTNEEIRVISSTTRAAQYDESMQISDFGAVQDVLYVRIYQISTAVGRGTPGIATLETLEPLT